MAITDEVPREREPGSDEELVQPEILVWYLSPPGLPLSVVTAAVKQLRPKVPIVILSERPLLFDEEFQTIDAIATVSSEAPYFLPIFKPFLSPKSGPVRYRRTNGELKSRRRLGYRQPRILDDLKATVASLPPTVRRQLIAELRTVFAELSDTA